MWRRWGRLLDDVDGLFDLGGLDLCDGDPSVDPRIGDRRELADQWNQGGHPAPTDRDAAP